jgi:hypothetical protein
MAVVRGRVLLKVEDLPILEAPKFSSGSSKIVLKGRKPLPY